MHTRCQIVSSEQWPNTRLSISPLIKDNVPHRITFDQLHNSQHPSIVLHNIVSTVGRTRYRTLTQVKGNGWVSMRAVGRRDGVIINLVAIIHRFQRMKVIQVSNTRPISTHHAPS